MLDALERIEVSLRTEIALCLGKYHPRAHRELRYLGRDFSQPRHRGGPSKHREWLQRLDRRASESKDQFAEHFRTKYPSQDMPVWMGVELLNFGPLSHLLSGIRNSDIAEIGRNYGGIKPYQLKSWARSLACTRNVRAHHSRLWNKPLVNQPSVVGSNVPAEFKDIEGREDAGKRLYLIACVARYLLRVANLRTFWKDRFVAHMQTFPKTDRLSLSSAGFPESWQNEDIWK